MKLSNLNIKGLNVYNDGYFDNLAQCTVLDIQDTLSFYSDEKYLEVVLSNKNIKSIICSDEYKNFFAKKNYGVIVSQNPKLTFFEIHNHLTCNLEHLQGYKDPTAIISATSVVSSNSIIGKNVIIEDFVFINKNVIIGDNTIIRSGCVLGGQGYEFKRNGYDTIFRVNHCGKTIIGNNVELKENVTIHTAVFGWDVSCIGDYSKIDAHTHIGHGSKVGKRVLIGSHSSISGNVQIEDDAYVGPGVVISNRVIIGGEAKVNIGSVVTKNVCSKTIVSGNFAIPHELFISDLKARTKK